MKTKVAYIPPVIFDGGNDFLKWCWGNRSGFVVHAFVELDAGEYQDMVDRSLNGLPLDLIEWKGRYFLVGESAEQFTLQNRIGAPKYTRDYQGILFCRVLADIFLVDRAPDVPLEVRASQAPIDKDYKQALIDSLKGSWSFKAGGKDYHVTIGQVKRYDEPFGGFLERNIQIEGKRVVATLEGLYVGVLDIGGGTVSTLIVSPDGKPEYQHSDSQTVGIKEATRAFASALKTGEHREVFKIRSIPLRVLREGMRTGKISWNGGTLDVEKEAAIACNRLLTVVKTVYDTQFNKGLGIGAIVCTGGGSGMLLDRIKVVIGHHKILPATDDLERIFFANVDGPNKYEQLEAAGI